MVLNAKITVFWDVMSRGLVKGNSVVEEPAASIFSESFAEQMEAARFSESLLLIYRTAHLHILEDCDTMRRPVYFSVYVSRHQCCHL
jgi:hypothetical protein